VESEKVRKSVGVSKVRLAKLLGVDRATLSIYELAPERVGPLRRAAFAVAYGALQLIVNVMALARMVIRRGKDRSRP
jgi:hypothetical protein